MESLAQFILILCPLSHLKMAATDEPCSESERLQNSRQYEQIATIKILSVSDDKDDLCTLIIMAARKIWKCELCHMPGLNKEYQAHIYQLPRTTEADITKGRPGLN